ncbi:hypothetical protein M1M85_00570 [Nitrospinaceae bacterium]|nr:hypothetical protein [Nitrospinaceae bacterium]
MWIKLVVIFFVILAQVSFIPRAGAGDEEFHIKILEALKRMNVRLVRIEANKLRSLKAVQESLLNQIMALRTSLEQIQATGEMSKTEMLSSVEGVKTKILDVESHIKNEVMQEFDGQNREDKRSRAQSQALFSQLKGGLATDMGTFSKVNQQQFKNFSEVNSKQLQQIVSVLEEQNKKLLQAQALFKTDLIPALDTQNEETRQALLRDLSQSRVVQKSFLESNHKQILASLGTVEEKNKALIEILKKSILVDETTKSLAETIQKNVGGTNQNIDQARKMIAILQEVLVQRMKYAAETEAALEVRIDEDLAEVKNNQKMLTSQLETLVSLSDQINKQSAQMEKSIQQSVVSVSDQINKQSAQMEKSIQQSVVNATNQINEKSSQIRESINKAIDMASNSAKSQTDLSNEKLSRLVDILKSFAVEQSKIDRELQALTASQGKVDQVLQGQKKLDVVLQSQQKVEKAIQGQKLGSIATQETILTTQKKMTEALKDLRRKANVNISRSEDILKKLKKQK